MDAGVRQVVDAGPQAERRHPECPAARRELPLGGSDRGVALWRDLVGPVTEPFMEGRFQVSYYL